MKVILPTYKRIGWIVRAYAHLHKKYWGVPVVLLAEDDYSDGQFEFVQPPNDEYLVWDKGEIPCDRFTDVLIWYLEQIQDQHVLIMLADYLVTRPVNVALLAQLEEYMQGRNILRGQVGDDKGLDRGQMTDTYKNIEIWEGNFLPTSLTPALWNRELFLEMINPADTPWGVEIKGRDKFPWNGCRSIAPKPGILSYVNAFRGRDMSYIVLTKAIYEEVGQYIKTPVRERELL